MRVRLSDSSWVPLAVTAVLLAPSVIWVVLDHSVWTWDPASYGEHALELNLAFARHRSTWWGELLTVSGPHAPGIEWIGQWFAGLRGVAGIERSLLAVTLLCQGGTLLLVWSSIRTCGGSPLAALASCLLIGAAPLFAGLSTKFLVEPLQAFTAAGFIWSAVASSRWRRLGTVTALLFWTSLALLAKVSSPLYCLVPGGVVFWNALRPSAPTATVKHPAVEAGRWICLGVTGCMALATAIWYRANLRGVLEFARIASSSSIAEIYGHRAPFLPKVAVWLGLISVSCSRWNLWALFPIAAVASIAVAKLHRGPVAQRPEGRLARAGAMSALQIVLTVAVLAVNVNEDLRFSFALLPCFAICAAWIFSWISHAAGALAVVATLLVQFCVVQAAALGLAVNQSLPYVDTVERNLQKQEAMAALVSATADAATNGRVVFIAVELRWLNHSSYRFAARKGFERTGFMPAPEGFGYELMAADAAFAAIEGEHPVIVISYADPNDPELRSVLNQNASALIGRFQRAQRFEELPFAEDPAIKVFRLRAGLTP
jgi:hypothetical protein